MCLLGGWGFSGACAMSKWIGVGVGEVWQRGGVGGERGVRGREALGRSGSAEGGMGGGPAGGG